jgi:hypothetical protein
MLNLPANFLHGQMSPGLVAGMMKTMAAKKAR